MSQKRAKQKRQEERQNSESFWMIMPYSRLSRSFFTGGINLAPSAVNITGEYPNFEITSEQDLDTSKFDAYSRSIGQNPESRINILLAPTRMRINAKPEFLRSIKQSQSVSKSLYPDGKETPPFQLPHMLDVKKIPLSECILPPQFLTVNGWVDILELKFPSRHGCSTINIQELLTATIERSEEQDAFRIILNSDPVKRFFIILS